MNKMEPDCQECEILRARSSRGNQCSEFRAAVGMRTDVLYGSLSKCFHPVGTILVVEEFDEKGH